MELSVHFNLQIHFFVKNSAGDADKHLSKGAR